jgi:hypothetical protein
MAIEFAELLRISGQRKEALDVLYKTVNIVGGATQTLIHRLIKTGEAEFDFLQGKITRGDFLGIILDSDEGGLIYDPGDEDHCWNQIKNNGKETFGSNEVFVQDQLLSANAEKIKASFNVDLFPVPAHDILEIQFSGFVLEQYVIKNSIGSLVTVREDMAIEPGSNFSINVSDLVPGMYILELMSTNGKSSINRFIVN